MRVVFIGVVEFSARALEELIEMPIQLVGVCTLKESNFNTDHVNLRPIAEKKIFPYAIPQILILKLDLSRRLHTQCVNRGWTLELRKI